MEILATRETGMGGKWVLVKYKDDFYAYGFEQDLHSFLGFPVNQYGTKEKVIQHCKQISMLCKANMNQYSKELLKKKCENPKGWELLIEQNRRELEMLTDFSKILKQ